MWRMVIEALGVKNQRRQGVHKDDVMANRDEKLFISREDYQISTYMKDNGSHVL